MSLLPESDHRVPGMPGARRHGRLGGSVGRHVAQLSVATGLALSAVAAVAPHAAADARSDRAETPTLAARESSRDALPHTGDGTLPVLLAGAGSLAIGGLALWFGGRRQAPRPNPRQ